METLTSMKKFKISIHTLIIKSRLFPYLTMIAKCIATTRMFALDFWTGCAALEIKSKINKCITMFIPNNKRLFKRVVYSITLSVAMTAKAQFRGQFCGHFRGQFQG